ncbi:MAG: hypothetical protein IAI50_02875 [Candidatus Eremiobacteraeota bacterium]|nr:hypothetical protein [Candidatus Eremiobacteraeota bacterium]
MKAVALCCIVFFVALFVYRSNDGYLYTYDSAPTSLFIFNLLQHHTFAFDSFRDGYFYGHGAAYVFAQAPNGHLAPIFPIGTALFTAPIFLFDYARAITTAPFPDITSLAFEPARLGYEKDAAAIVGAAAAVVFFSCARLVATTPIALLTTIAFAFGTQMWTIGSQALWQHGTINLITLAMTYALLRATRARTGKGSNAFTSWLVFAGLCGGFLPVVRPTATLFLLAGFAFACRRGRRDAWPFLAGAIVGIAPGIIWNVAVFHSIVGGYSVDTGSYAFTLRQAGTGLAGLTISPSRGLVVYTPLVLLSIVGAARAARSTSADARLLVFLAIAAAFTIVNYSFYESWIGGSCFGPRFLTDVSSVGALLLAYALSGRDVRRRDGRSALAFNAAFALALCYCIGVQVAGANGEPKSAWSDVPVDAGQHPERVWQTSDTQIERDVLATYRLWRSNPVYTATYPAGFHGLVLAVRRGPRGLPEPRHTLTFAPGEAADVTALAANVGPSRWYGYESGVYFGQARVRVRVYAGDGSEVSESYLYIAGSPQAAERTSALGTLRAPATPGN